jgi:negative regulator of sigma-B (phosphoserine phosphatase)
VFDSGASGPIEWAVAGQPLPGEDESGDGWVVADTSGATLLGVIDGLGHGPRAAVAARHAAAVLGENPAEPLDALFVLCHQALGGTRGAAITVAVIDHVHATLAWLGVGNVAGSLVRTSPGGPMVQSSVMQRGGVIGHQLPEALRPVRTPIQPGDVLLLGSDGLATGFDDRPDLGQSAAALAQGILAHCAKGTDDALVLVARYRGRYR